MEHNPSFSSVHPIEGIQTANKNIYSYFMKNDNSYCVDSKHRYSLYRKETDKTYIVVISKYESNTGDYTYKHNSNSIEMECLIGENKHNLHTKKVTLSNLFKTIKEIEYSLPGTEDIKASDIFIGLVYPDGLNRVSIMNMVDSVLNHSGFKGILLLPLTLSVCFGLGLSNSVVYSEMDKTVTLVEDNCVFDTFTADRPGSTTLYGSDVVEEFLRKEEPVKNTLEMVCFMCNAPFEISEFSMHFLNKHMIDIYADQKHSDTLLHKCAPKEDVPVVEEPARTDLDTVGKDMLRKLAPPERSTKITSTVVFITNKSIPEATADDEAHESEGAEALPADSQATPELTAKIVPPIIDESTTSTVLYVEDKKKAHTAWNGVFALANIEPSKDLWLTDKEWRSVGLRVLKEKVLFSI
ncbi:hypothetical protein NEIRO03_1921 [Nematocida sp. AWRm78]|nr:hypothetical protein NEIRO02_1949 [Nematocida sp. AWRm79]KAI5185039.1 hypothetical protein NEIRO03_1921 [Nematocida sp. AWRm78]